MCSKAKRHWIPVFLLIYFGELWYKFIEKKSEEIIRTDSTSFLLGGFLKDYGLKLPNRQVASFTAKLFLSVV